MARTYAKLMTSIWDDPEWRQLDSGPQRLYLMLLSQPGLTFCGVVAHTPRRWAGLVAHVTLKTILADLAALEARRFVVVDRDTEEVWIRSFVIHDGVLKSPNLVVAAHEDFRSIVSDTIKQRFLEGLPEGFREGFLKPPPRPTPKGSVNGSGKGSDIRARTAPTASTASPPAPAAEPHSGAEPFPAKSDAEPGPETKSGGEITIESQPPDPEPNDGLDPLSEDGLTWRLLSNWPKRSEQCRLAGKARTHVAECLAVVDPKLVDEAIGDMLGRDDRPRSPAMLVSVVKSKAAQCGVTWPETAA